MKEKEYRMASAARGALLFMRGVPNVALGDRVIVRNHAGQKRNGQVIRTSKDVVLVQVFEGTDDLDLESTWVRFLEEPFELPLSPDVGFAFAAPTTRVSTDAARGALPTHVSHPTAVLGHGRFASLLQGLATGDPELISIGFTDELHVPYRLPLIPGAHNAMGCGYDAGAWGVTISGSGSGLIALCPPEDSAAVAAAMYESFSAGSDDPDCWGMAMEPDLVGLVVDAGP